MNMKIKNPLKKQISFLLCVIMIATIFLAAIPVKVFAAEGTITNKENTVDGAGNGPYFEIENEHGSTFAFCINFNANIPNAGDSIGTPILSTNDDLRRVLYWGWGGPEHSQTGYGWNLTAMAASVAQGNMPSTGFDYYTSHFAHLATPPEEFEVYVVPTRYSYQELAYWVLDTNPMGNLTIYKRSSNPVSENNNMYTLSGTVFELLTTSGTFVARATTDANGKADFTNIKVGNYVVKEVTPPNGFILNNDTINVSVIRKTTQYYDFFNDPLSDPVSILLQKVDSEPGGTAQGDAKLDAVFMFEYYDGLYTMDETVTLSPHKTWEFKALDNGLIDPALSTKVSGDALYYDAAGKPIFPLGTYIIYETVAPTGYLVSTEKHIVQIKEDTVAGSIVAYKAPVVPNKIITGGVAIEKWDNEINKPEAQSSATLEDAKLEIYNRSEKPVMVEGKLYAKDELITTLYTDVKGEASTGNDYLPYGTYEVVEVEAPEGYVLEGKIRETFEIRENETMVVLTGDRAIKDNPIRGDLKLVKVSDGDMKRMADVPFEIRSLTTNEAHVVLTDKNGQLDTSSNWNLHSTNTNQGTTSDDGIWFGDINALDDSVGALLYDTYLITELPCDANEDKVILEPFKVFIYQNKTVVDLGTITNDYAPEPQIGTTASEKDTGKQEIHALDEVTIVDKVTYTNLVKGREYTIKGVLMDKSTNNVLLIDGKEVIDEKTFVAANESGSIELTFTFNASTCKGKEVVVFERLYFNGKEVAAHADINDENQTIKVLDPSIGTTAINKETGTNTTYEKEKVTVVDTVKYENLIPRQEYKLSAIVMDKMTNKPLLQAGGNEIIVEKTFTPDQANGSVDIEIEVDMTNLTGTQLVMFETLYYKNKEIAIHADINDDNQTITVVKPSIDTQASQTGTGLKVIPISELISLTDTVSYKNLIPGMEYIVKGTLMDKDTGKAVQVNGKNVVAEKTFTPISKDGTVDIIFTLDAMSLVDKSVVVFEELYDTSGMLIAEHKDINDLGQTVKFVPEPTTTTPQETTPTPIPPTTNTTNTGTINTGLLSNTNPLGSSTSGGTYTGASNTGTTATSTSGGASSNTTGTTSKASSVNTGDESQAQLLMTIMVIALLGYVLLCEKKKLMKK